MQPTSNSLTRLQLSDRATDIFKAKKIGVALGPGLPIGLVDLGMLIALKQLKIEVSLISGTSMGAVMGRFTQVDYLLRRSGIRFLGYLKLMV